MIILYLTCANEAEASTISQKLLEAKLISCARRAPVRSAFWWQGQIQHDDEILLMMESIESKFDAIVAIVNKLHSYQEYVLTAVPVLKTTPGVETWLNESLNN